MADKVAVRYDVAGAFTAQPKDVWERIDSVLKYNAPDYRSVIDNSIANELPDSTPQAFIQAVAPALTPANLVPRVIPSPTAQHVASKDIERANTWTGILRWTYRVGRFRPVFRRFLQDATAYGAAHIYVYIDEDDKRPAFEFLPHDKVAYEPGVDIVDAQWLVIKREISKGEAEDLGIPATKLELSNDNQSTRVVYYELWDDKARKWYLLDSVFAQFKENDYPEHYRRAPLMSIHFGEMPGNRYPMGLLYHWLPKLWELQKLKTWLMLNAHLAALQPMLISELAFADEAKDRVLDLFGATSLVVPQSFFRDGKPAIVPLNPKILSAEFYNYVSTLKDDIQRESHLSDIMQSKQLRSGISKEEVKAIVAAQTQWLQDLLDVVEMSLIDGGDIVMGVWGHLLSSLKGGVKVLSELSGGKAASLKLDSKDTYKGARLELDIDPLGLDTFDERRERAKSVVELMRDPEAQKFIKRDRAMEFVLQELNAHELYLDPDAQVEQQKEEFNRQKELEQHQRKQLEKEQAASAKSGTPVGAPVTGGNPATQVGQQGVTGSAAPPAASGQDPLFQQLVGKLTQYMPPQEAEALAEALASTDPELAQQVLNGTPEQIQAIIEMVRQPQEG